MKPPSKRAVIVVCDSLRADLIDPTVSPNLAALRSRVANFTGARSVFPSTTRVSSACLATGCHPAAHGLLGNTMVLDEGDGLVCLSVGKPDFLDRLRRATGRTLARPTLAERLRHHGGSVVMSNVSPGAAYLQDPDGHGYVYHRSGSYGPDRLPLDDGLSIETGADGDARMTERFCTEILVDRAPALAVLWLSEPDHTGHREPLGSPAHRQAISHADRCVRMVLDTVDSLDPTGDDVLLVVCSDHGMETVRRQIDLEDRLVAAGFKQSRQSGDIVVAPNGTSALIHFSLAARGRLAAVSDWLQRQDFTGRVIAGNELSGVGLEPVGSLGLAITLKSDREANPFGVVGRSDSVVSAFSSESGPGCGQHGGLGIHEQRPFLFIRGGGIAPGDHDAPVSLVDLGPTILRYLALPWEEMDGRPLP